MPCALCLMPSLMHERWFVDGSRFPVQLAAALEPGALASVGTALGIVAVAAVAWHATGKKPVVPGPLALGTSERGLAILFGIVPLVLAAHLAVTLFVSGVRIELFVPNLTLASGSSVAIGSFVGAIVSLAQIAIGLALFYGFFTRAAAILLILLWLAGCMMFGPLLLLEHALVPGIAAALAITGRGPFAVDALLDWRWNRPWNDMLPRAMQVLRVGAGVSLVTLALTEKLWNIPLGMEFLEHYPANFLPALGIPVSNATFLHMAGTVELLAGLLLIFNVYVRLGILVLWLPFNVSLAAFGWRELVGHLPIYGTMAVLALWGSGGEVDLRALGRGLRQRPTLLDETVT